MHSQRSPRPMRLKSVCALDPYPTRPRRHGLCQPVNAGEGVASVRISLLLLTPTCLIVKYLPLPLPSERGPEQQQPVTKQRKSHRTSMIQNQQPPGSKQHSECNSVGRLRGLLLPVEGWQRGGRLALLRQAVPPLSLLPPPAVLHQQRR